MRGGYSELARSLAKDAVNFRVVFRSDEPGSLYVYSTSVALKRVVKIGPFAFREGFEMRVYETGPRIVYIIFVAVEKV